MIKKQYGFTLAEVLITLAIIGVVAAMTIPTLVANYQNKAWNTSASVFERKLEEALKSMNSQQTLAGHTSTKNFVTALSGHFKINKICDTNDIASCFKSEISWPVIDIAKGGEINNPVNITTIKTANDLVKENWDTEALGVQFANGITGIIAFSGFSPWRDEKCSYSLRNFAEYNGFLPRLSFWFDDPLSIPIDFPEIISAIVPRSIMLISPLMDKYLNNEIMQKSIMDIESCYELYNSRQQFEYYQPKEINRLTNSMIDYLICFLKTHVKE